MNESTYLRLPGNSDLQSLVDYFQELLGLDGWYIKASFCKDADLVSGGGQADITYNLRQKKSVLRVLDPSMWPKNDYWEQDIVESVAHELTHIHVAMVREEPHVETIEEQAVVSLSRALAIQFRMIRTTQDRMEDMVAACARDEALRRSHKDSTWEG